MNAIKGEANAVNKRRGWKQPLDVSLHNNAVSQATFDAMQAAVTASLPDFRAWMKVKAKLHGHDGSPFVGPRCPAPLRQRRYLVGRRHRDCPRRVRRVQPQSWWPS
ncbi:MAG: hypothetical protein R2706_00405 [Acidimicrobiales bacterium]